MTEPTSEPESARIELGEASDADRFALLEPEDPTGKVVWSVGPDSNYSPDQPTAEGEVIENHLTPEQIRAQRDTMLQALVGLRKAAESLQKMPNPAKAMKDGLEAFRQAYHESRDPNHARNEALRRARGARGPGGNLRNGEQPYEGVETAAQRAKLNRQRNASKAARAARKKNRRR